MKWTWIRRGHLKREIESLIPAPQDNAKIMIENTQKNS